MTVPFKKESHRREKVEELIKHEISRIILQELSDPRIALCTITRVKLAGDLKSANVHVSVLGEEANQRTTMRGLEHARHFIQKRLFQELRLRYTPTISFHLDHSIERSIRISKILREEGIPETDGFGDTDDVPDLEDTPETGEDDTS